ncbi:MAG: hypothetical protein ABFC77_02205 [Thermoguttaceae bacterium]
MENADFCRTVLRQLRAQAEIAARRYPKLRHMLVLPTNEGLLLPPRPGGHPFCFMEPPRVITSFGESQVAGVLPPKGCWPDGLSPIRAIVAEQDYAPYQPLGRKPYRIHLFFGCDEWMNALNELCDGIMDAARDVDRGLQNCLGSVFWHSNDCLHGKKITTLDAWLCTLHWWAWKATDTPIFTQPKVVMGKNAIDCNRTNKAVTERLSFSLIDLDVFTASVAMIDLIDRFFDAPPDLTWDVDYPCVSENIEPALEDGVEGRKSNADTGSGAQRSKMTADDALYDKTGEKRLETCFGEKETSLTDANQDNFGVTLADVAAFFEPNDDKARKDLVRRWINGKKITAVPLGKCPNDARAQLYRLSDILSDMERINGFMPGEKVRLRQHLIDRQRSPKSV